MKIKYSKFLLIKLIFVLFAAVGSGVIAILFSLTVNDTTDPTFALIITKIAPAVIFYAFIYSFESRIKIPECVLDLHYFVTFTARETSVYAIFMVPVTAAAALVNNGTVENLLSPHMTAHSLGCNVLVNYLCAVVLFAIIAAAAHYKRSKKPINIINNGGDGDDIKDDDSKATAAEITKENEENDNET